jgi:hypothetical protein
MSFESLFAGYAAEIVRFSSVGYLEFGRSLIKNCAANWIGGHFSS